MRNNIGYHTRAYGNNSLKLSGGSFGGSLNQETVERLTRMFDVTVKPSGTVVFVDKSGREVYLYVTVDASETVKGKAALQEFRAEKRRLQEIQAAKDRDQEEELDELMAGMSHDEIVRRLKGE